MSTLELNAQFQQALEALENTRQSVLVTGRAGTGKSTLLQYFREHSKKKVVVLAPTGVAAVNIDGQTIHSFCGFLPSVTLAKVKKISFPADKIKLLKHLDTVVVDEVSMVRADLFDCLEKFLRLNGPNTKQPFGGIQMALFGDLYQLPPVVTSSDKALFGPGKIYDSPYFFDASAYAKMDFALLQLEKIYRQSDPEFIRLLNAIRNKSITDEDLVLLNARHQKVQDLGKFAVYLTTTNNVACSINEARLEGLRGKEWRFVGALSGKFERSALPTEKDLRLKNGSQVMLLNNDPAGRWVNGTLAVIEAIEAAKDEAGANDVVVWVRLPDGERESVRRHSWHMYKFVLNEKNRRVDSESVGSFIQFPLRLAWALTIHKAQGKTFQRVHIDFGRGTFEHGQAYVALSRCTSMDGLTLERPVQKRHVLMDWRVVKFLTSIQYEHAHATQSVEDILVMIKQAIKNKQRLRMVYLKGKDEKSERSILPKQIREMEFQGYPFTGVIAYCYTRKEERVFRLERILSLRSI